MAAVVSHKHKPKRRVRALVEEDSYSSSSHTPSYSSSSSYTSTSSSEDTPPVRRKRPSSRRPQNGASSRPSSSSEHSTTPEDSDSNSRDFKPKPSQPNSKYSKLNGVNGKSSKPRRPKASSSSNDSTGGTSSPNPAASDFSSNHSGSVYSTPSASQPNTNPSLQQGSLFHRLTNADIKYREEKPKILRHFIVGKVIGEGSYGKVKEGIDSKTKKLVAIKIFNRKTLRKVIGGEASVEREVDIICGLSHKNVIQILSHFLVESRQKLYIVFEYMGCGSLTGVLERAPEKRLGPHQARKLFGGLVSGLEHLREHRILHRDIKPDNLLLDSHGDLKISDFGVAERLDSTLTKEKANGDIGGIGSPAFQAPELIASPQLGTKKSRRTVDLLFKSDIWSAGIVLYIMIVGDYPFPNSQGNIMLLFEDITEGKFDIPSWVDPLCADLIRKMMTTNPEARIDLPEIKAHPWMTASLAKSGSVPIQEIASMWPNHDKSSLSAVVKKLQPLLKREHEAERASRFSFDADRPSFDDLDSERPPAATSGSRCSVM